MHSGVPKNGFQFHDMAARRGASGALDNGVFLDNSLERAWFGVGTERTQTLA